MGKKAITRWVRFIKRTAEDSKRLALAFIGTWLLSALIFGVLEAMFGASGGYSIVDCLYWSMTVMSTVGFGDILPTSDITKIFAIIKMAWSIIYVIPVLVSTVIEMVKPDIHKDTDEEQDWRRDALLKLLEERGLKMRPYPEKDY